MKAYADSSLLVSAFTVEERSEVARSWLADLPGGALFTSSWCQTEIASALAMKVRRKQLSVERRFAISRQIFAVLASAGTVVSIVDAHLAAATALIERCELPLRGPDALHLAIGQAADVAVWTFDEGMAAAGAALGLGTRLLD